MEDEFFNTEHLDTTSSTPYGTYGEPKEDEWPTLGGSEETTQNDDDPWLTDSTFTESTNFTTSQQSNDSTFDWGMSTGASNNNSVVDIDHGSQGEHKGSAVSFKGYGQCDCGCGSFGGHGSICTYCGHPFSAHSRYKK